MLGMEPDVIDEYAAAMPVECDGYQQDLGCDGACNHPGWAELWAGKCLCAQCAKRFEEASSHWILMTREDQ